MDFTPTSEALIANPDEENFITEHPKDIISAGRFHNVPYVVGTLPYESLFFIGKLATII
jgi:hypothetical protein